MIQKKIIYPKLRINFPKSFTLDKISNKRMPRKKKRTENTELFLTSMRCLQTGKRRSRQALASLRTQMWSKLSPWIKMEMKPRTHRTTTEQSELTHDYKHSEWPSTTYKKIIAARKKNKSKRIKTLLFLTSMRCWHLGKRIKRQSKAWKRTQRWSKLSP